MAQLQFLLPEHGLPSGVFDGRFGPSPPSASSRPPCRSRCAVLSAPLPSDLFGPCGDRLHAGIDYPARAGAPAVAAPTGRVTWAAWRPDGWGRLVVVAHGRGLRTLHAHLSRIDVVLGQRLEAGSQLGLVGASGRSNGPHLHFEARVRGAAVDPLPAFAKPS